MPASMDITLFKKPAGFLCFVKSSLDTLEKKWVGCFYERKKDEEMCGFLRLVLSIL